MNPNRKKILIVEDSPVNIDMLVGTLRSEYQLGICKSGPMALEYLQQQIPDLILLDIMMPEMNGFEVCHHVKADPATRDIPVIFITAMGETEQKTKGFEAGAVDYITKPFHAAEVRARVRTHLNIQSLHRELDRKSQEISRALDLKSRQMDTLIGNLPGMAYRCSAENGPRVEFVSEGSLKLTGYTPNQFMDRPGWHPGLLAVDDDKQLAVDEIASAMDKTHRFELTYRILTADGEQKWVWEQGCGICIDGTKKVEGVIFDITEKQKAELSLRRENNQLRQQMLESNRFNGIIGQSKALQGVFDMILKAGATEDSVIIYGESGTGKELVAKAVHDNSPRADKPFIPVNCSAVPETLFESEFFGHKKGAFSGANVDKVGFLDVADGGTLFLDELGEIDPRVQVKLLRVMDGNGFIPVGGSEVKKPDIRFLAATNRDLKKMVAEGSMREDFFFRIHIIPITIPPLRERAEDIPLLVRHFLNAYPKGAAMPPVTEDIMESLIRYRWPGNIRELQNVLYQYLTLGQLDLPADTHTDLSGISRSRGRKLRDAMDAFEKRHIEQTLVIHDFQKGKTAEALGIDRKTLFRKMKQLEIGQ